MLTSPLLIFLSSTTTDMGPYREKVANALVKIKQVPVSMRDFGAYSVGARAMSVEKVTETNLFVGLMGYRHGEGVSELEYTTAMQHGLFVFMYAPDPSYRVTFPGIPSQMEQKQQAFFDRVQRENHTICTYRDPEELPVLVVIDIQRTITGGVHGVIALRKGCRELQTGNYPSALADLSWAVHLLPDDGDPPFYLAIALLQGREPRNVSKTEIMRIEELLQVAANLKPSREVFAVWAAVKLDFWVRNGFDQPHAQLARQLAERASAAPSDPNLLDLVVTLQPAFAKRYFG